CFRGAPDLGQRTNRAALHPDHHRRGRAGLACGRRRNDALPGADTGVHHPPEKASVARHHFRRSAQMTEAPRDTLISRFLKLRRGPWENLATVIIALGVLMLLQPLSMTLYTYSFATTLVGTAMFIIVTKFRE